MLEFRQDVCVLIRKRTSTRTFGPEAPPEDSRNILREACSRLVRGRLGTPCRFVLLDRRGSGPPGERLGTYGVIRGAETYLAGAASRGPYDLLDFGYLFELLVLKATECGLGTCWLGGTFRRGDLDRALGLRDSEILPAVSPVGVPARRRSLVDGLFRLGAGSRARRPWGELFFDGAGKPLHPDGLPPAYRQALEMVRLAPSASNRQPWRLLRSGGAVHFFLCRTAGYRRAPAVDLQRLDIGIAMAHLELALSASEGTGHWSVLEVAPELPGSDAQRLEYVVSWHEEPGPER